MHQQRYQKQPQHDQSHAFQRQMFHSPTQWPRSDSFDCTIPFSELKLYNKTLGSGSYGTVFKGRWREKNVAVKQYRTKEEIDSFKIEVQQLSRVKHHNIVILFGASIMSDKAYLVMEYAEGGSLSHLLHECKHQNYDLRHACSWAMQVANGVAYLHSIKPKAIMHRDLKPANLLLFNRGKILKICDFGTASAVKTHMTNNTGSAAYMAPEVFATDNYLESGDVYSWSIIFWELLVRQHPYDTSLFANPYQILWRVQTANLRPNPIENCPEIIWNLITRSWHRDPKQRPSMFDVAEEMRTIYALTGRCNSIYESAHDDNGVTPIMVCSTIPPPIDNHSEMSLDPCKQPQLHRLSSIKRRLAELQGSNKRDTAMDVVEELQILRSKGQALQQQCAATPDP